MQRLRRDRFIDFVSKPLLLPFRNAAARAHIGPDSVGVEDAVLEETPPRWELATRTHEMRTCRHHLAWPGLGLILQQPLRHEQLLTSTHQLSMRGSYTFTPRG